MKEVIHFNTQQERLDYLKHGFDEIVPKKVEEAKKDEKSDKKTEKATKTKKSAKKGAKKDEVQAE